MKLLLSLLQPKFYCYIAGLVYVVAPRFLSILKRSSNMTNGVGVASDCVKNT
jgi:hypothetical protein